MFKSVTGQQVACGAFKTPDSGSIQWDNTSVEPVLSLKG